MKILFAIQSYQYLLAQTFPHFPNAQKGEVEVKYFPDGERYQRIINTIRNQDIIIIGGTTNDNDTLELYDLACACAKYGAESITLFIPYFGYSTMERAVKNGEIVTAKTRARLLSSIPQMQHFSIMMLDLHTEGLPHYFENHIRPIHLYAKPLIIEACHELAGNDFVLACTDAGRAKWVESLANDMQVNGAFVFKRRLSGENTEVTSINADVKNKKVIIYDDMIRTGGSLIKSAQAYKDAGATEIFAITTHGLFSQNALPRIQSSGLFSKIVATNSHPNTLALESDFLIVKSLGKLLGERLSALLP
jgi:ribose-phosphate pyrophosphokinase